jgi:hypothetical protein
MLLSHDVRSQVWEHIHKHQLTDQQQAVLVADLLLGAFVFRKTPQGSNYWHDVYDELRRAAREYDTEDSHV